MDGYTIGVTGLPTIPKTVPGKLDYTFDWAAWLAPLGEAILSKTVTVATGMNKLSDTLMGDKVVVSVDGGENGQSYAVDCEIVTATRRETRSIVIQVFTRR